MDYLEMILGNLLPNLTNNAKVHMKLIDDNLQEIYLKQKPQKYIYFFLTYTSIKIENFMYEIKIILSY